jgi:hypothetical protein
MDHFRLREVVHMSRWLRPAFKVATAAMAVVSLAALIPFLGRPAPAFGQLGFVGGFGGTCSGIGGFGLGGCTFGTGFSGGFGSTSGLGGIGGFGGFVVATPQASVEAGESVPLIFAWVVPEPATWRDLHALEVRIRNRSRVALWVRWDEATNTIVQIDHVTGKPSGRAWRPGRAGRVTTRLATLTLPETAVEDSGPGGDSVALLLPVSFTPAAAARSYLVEVGADHDDGQIFFGTVGKITVTR